MDQNQKRYAMSRIKEAEDLKIESAREKHTKPVATPSGQTMINAIRNGEVDLKWNVKITDTLQNAFKFNGLEKEHVLDVAAFNKESQSIRRAASLVRDEIMLGDDAKAKALIQKFCGK